MKNNNICDFEQWGEPAKGIYRYILSAGACYEIHILYHSHETDILTAKASLFIVGDWNSPNKTTFFERECLLSEQPVLECINKAFEDYKENVKEEN